MDLDVILLAALILAMLVTVVLSRAVRRSRHAVKRVSGIALASLIVLIAAGLVVGLGYRFWYFHRTVPPPVEQTLFQGVTYIREIRKEPRPMVIHVLKIDLQAPGIGFFITPGQPVNGYDLPARTTSQFLTEFGVQLAVNGGDFEPWKSVMIYDYYPHVGDGVHVLGLASSKGNIYSPDIPAHPTLYFSADNKASFETPLGPIYNAISGLFIFLRDGKWVEPSTFYRTNYGNIHPRTVYALDKAAHTLILIVVDGRQPNYSEGATLDDLGEIALKYGADIAMNQDGGGSSAMVMQGPEGHPALLNSPIDAYLPGRERAIGNHLGIFARLPVS